MSINKILLMGNPNVGKSTLFSRLAGAKVMISNYPGTTVEFVQGKMTLNSEKPMIIDVPGTYSLTPTSKAEEVAVHVLEGENGVVINIVDATNLERNLYLTIQILERKRPVIIALNMWDDAKHKGIEIDIKKLEEKLGVPVIATCGLTGQGIKELVERLGEARVSNLPRTTEPHLASSCEAQDKPVVRGSDSQRWLMIGAIVEEVQKLHHRHHTFLEALEDLSIKPFSGILVALAVLYGSFWVVRFMAENLIGYVFSPLFEKLWLPVLMKLSVFLGEGSFWHQIFIGHLVDGKINFGQSFGILTTGFFVPLAVVLPYVFSFYFMLGLLEDFGYLPRLAVLMDSIMHHLGLHGYAVIPFILGLGCNVPGALAVRMLSEKREKFIAGSLLSVCVPCMAQIAMIVGLVGQRGGKYVALVFGILFILFIVKGLILNKVLKGESPEILIEIPPYRIPQPVAVAQKLWLRISGFLKEALPYVLLGVLLVSVLQALKIIDFFSAIFTPVLTKLWGLPKETMGALIVGFLRKDVAVGMLGPLNLTTKQLVIGSTVLAIYFPCAATFAVLLRELGIKDMIKSSVIMISTALVVGTILNLIL